MPSTNARLVQQGEPYGANQYTVKPYAVLALLGFGTLIVLVQGGEEGLKSIAWNGLLIFASDYLIYVILKRVKQYVDERRERKRLS